MSWFQRSNISSHHNDTATTTGINNHDVESKDQDNDNGNNNNNNNNNNKNNNSNNNYHKNYYNTNQEHLNGSSIHNSINYNHTTHDSYNDSKKNMLSIKDAVKILYPNKYATASSSGCSGRHRHHNHALVDRSRFSQLLLEHGECRLQDWAVIAYSTPVPTSYTTSSSTTTRHSTPTMTHHNHNNNGGEATGPISTANTTTKTTTTTTQWAQSADYTNTTNHHNFYQPQKFQNNNHNHNKNNNPYSYNNNSNHKNMNMGVAGTAGATGALEKDWYPSAHMSKIEGRLHLCSRSVVLEPTDHSRGIVRCPFRKMSTAPAEYPSTKDTQGHPSTGGKFEAMCIEFQCTRHLIIKENNMVGPFEAVAFPINFRFTFLHSSPAPFLQLCHKLYNFSSNSMQNNDHNHNTTHNNHDNHPHWRPQGEEGLQQILKPMLDRPFDVSNLVDVREVPLSSTLRCSFLSPLQTIQGCVALTKQRIYFQPASSPHEQTKAVSWLQKDVVAIACRYNGLRDSALELYFKDATSILLAFEKKRDREQVLQLLTNKHSIVRFTDRDFVVKVVQHWQKGYISNFEYLLALNSAAGRTFHDLSRYPVFPWVIADYSSSKLDLHNPSTFRDLSKPVGALNQSRLDYFKTRLEGMQDMDDAFLYGTHYSAPGYVLYYLIRSMPEHMLCLQNGKFDAPDRMFYCVAHCYSCVQTNHADVKELIPEFYSNHNDFDFLINARGLQLGATQNGDRVDDVRLPPWAKSPRDFLKKNRKALESEICTRMLPKWIDLIFGCKSRGESAMEANNLFHPCSYLGPAELATMAQEEDRIQAELQATEFGIVPDPLFCGPHPLKQDTVDDTFISSEIGRSSLSSTTTDSYSMYGAAGHAKDTWELLDPPPQPSSPQHHKDDNNHNPVETTEDDHKYEDSYDPRSPSNYGNFLQGEEHHPSSATTNSMSTRTDSVTVDRYSSSNHKGGQGDPYQNSSSSAPQFPVRGQGDPGPSGSAASAGMGAFSLFNNNDPSNLSPPSPVREEQISAVDSNSPTTTTTTTTTNPWDMEVIERKQIHGDAVSGCVLVLQPDQTGGGGGGGGGGGKPILTTTSLDGGLMAHHVAMFNHSSMDNNDYRRGFTGTLSRFSYMAMNRGQVTPSSSSSSSQSKLSQYRTHTSRDPLACLAMVSDGAGGQIAFAGGHDDVVLAYGINSACAVASVYSHRDAVTGLDIIARSKSSFTTNTNTTTNNINSTITTANEHQHGHKDNYRHHNGSSLTNSSSSSCSLPPPSSLWLEKSTHIMVSGSWDATVKVWSVTVAKGETVSVNREPLAELFDADSSIVCVSAVEVPNAGRENNATNNSGSTGGIIICAGCADGSFCVWNLHNDGVKVVIHNEPARRGSGPCSVVQWSTENGRVHLFTGFSTGKVASFTLENGNLLKESAVSFGIAVNCLVYSDGILLVGCADGGLRLISVTNGTHFDSKPSLWNSVNNKSSPGISSISITYTGDFLSGGGKCICCTGAEDGSVALFELKKAR